MQNCAAPHRIGKAVDSLELSVGGAESTAGNRQSTINNRQSRSASPALRTCGISTPPKGPRHKSSVVATRSLFAPAELLSSHSGPIAPQLSQIPSGWLDSPVKPESNSWVETAGADAEGSCFFQQRTCGRKSQACPVAFVAGRFPLGQARSVVSSPA